MNRRFHKLFFLVFTFSFFILAAQNNYNVRLYIHDLSDSQLFIQGYCGSKTYLIDSTLVDKDGGFHFQLKDLPMGMYMAKTRGGDIFSFVLDKSKDFSIEIYANGEYFVKNCPENDAYLLYQKQNQYIQRQMTDYRALASKDTTTFSKQRAEMLKKIDSFDVFEKSFYKTYPNNLITIISKSLKQSAPGYFFENGKLKNGMEQQYATYYRQHYWDNFYFWDNRILYTPYFIKQFNTYITQITLQDADTVCKAVDEFIETSDSKGGKEYSDYIIAWYLENLPKLPFSFNEVLYTHIVDKYLNRASTYLMPSMIDASRNNVDAIRQFLPGKTMPNLTLNTFDGKRVSLYSLKNKYTVLYFFSAMCESCKKNLDVLKDFYKNKSKEYDVEIYSVDIEQDYALANAHYQVEKFPWIVTHGSYKELEPYHFPLDHTPQLYILDRNKTIINKTAVYDHVEKTIKIVSEKK